MSSQDRKGPRLPQDSFRAFLFGGLVGLVRLGVSAREDDFDARDGPAEVADVGLDVAREHYLAVERAIDSLDAKLLQIMGISVIPVSVAIGGLALRADGLHLTAGGIFVASIGCALALGGAMICLCAVVPRTQAGPPVLREVHGLPKKFSSSKAKWWAADVYGRASRASTLVMHMKAVALRCALMAWVLQITAVVVAVWQLIR